MHISLQKMRQNKLKSESRGFQKLTFKLPLTFLYQNLLQRKNNSWHCSETLRFKKGTCFCQRAISLDGSSITISFPLSQSEWHQSGECKIWRLFFIKKIVTNRALITSKRLFSYESLVKNLILEGTLNIQLS